MRHILSLIIFMSIIVASLWVGTGVVKAQPFRLTPTPSPTATPVPEATTKPDLTQKTEESVGPLEEILEIQELGPIWPFNPVKYAIRSAVVVGVPANTIVLLLLLPVVAAVIAAFRHIVGLRGFGILLPASLSVVFVATGPVLGIGLFLMIVLVTVLVRFILRKFKIKLQYLPRMAMILLFVVIAVLLLLFAAPVINQPALTNVSIFPILILVLLAEDFTKVQIGKSAKTAVNITTETLILALVSFIFLTSSTLQRFAITYPELLLLSVVIFDFLMGKYSGLRFSEYWRFRKIINN